MLFIGDSDKAFTSGRIRMSSAFMTEHFTGLDPQNLTVNECYVVRRLKNGEMFGRAERVFFVSAILNSKSKRQACH